MIFKEDDWRQHYPTYTFADRDIVLKEYDSAARSLESEERIFLNASNITLVVGAAAGSLAVGSLDRLIARSSDVLPRELIVGVLGLLTVGFAIISLKYFADRQRALVFASRKVVVLRRMLGLSYGRLQLVLPNWRVEGADQPFAVRLFPGWASYAAYPFWIVTSVSAAVLLFLAAAMLEAKSLDFRIAHPSLAWSIFVVVWVAILAALYRRSLYDTHERSLLSAARGMSYVLRLGLIDDVEYVIYRATLARFENSRLKLNTQNLRLLLVFIEDRRFLEHRGISWRANVRAVLGMFGLKRRSGGSTITQQLARSLFIRQPEKTVRRKIVELVLSRWLEQIATKDQILELYLASVRFERGVYGVAAAMRHFFGRHLSNPTPAEAFFLIERVSNVRSRVLAPRINQLIEDAVEMQMLSPGDARDLAQLYQRMVGSGKLYDDEVGGVARLTKHWQVSKHDLADGGALGISV